MEQSSTRPRQFVDVQDMAYGRQLLWARPVFWSLLAKALKLRYRRTTLGFLWSLLNPLFMLVIYSTVFTMIFRVGLPNYPVHLIAGMLPFGFFRNSVSTAAANLALNSRFYTKQYLPKMIFPMVGMCSHFVDFALAYTVLLVGGYFFLGFSPSEAMAILPVSLALLLIFTTGCTLVMSVAGIYWADLRQILVVVMQTTFYATPILYSLEMIPGPLRPFMKLNPLYYFVTNFTLPLYFHRVPDITQLVVSLIIAVAALAVGIWVFLKYQADVVFKM